LNLPARFINKDMARILLLLWVIVLIVSVSGKNILSLLSLRGGFSGPSIQLDGEGEFVEIRHSKVSKLDGKYNRDEEDINGRPHFARRLEDDPRGDAIHLYWSGSQWVLHYDTDPSMNFDNLIAYAKIRVANPKGTSTFWHVRKGKAYESAPSLMVNDRASHIEGQERHGQCSGDGVKHEGCVQREQLLGIPHIMGVPQQLFPLYTSFMFDAIATGLAMPLLPFYVMGLGANAFQLSMIVSSNYVAQMIGCLVVGQISDRYGRKLVLSMALFASFLSYLGVSQSTTLTQVTLARIVIGSCGGLVPIIQSGVADVTSDEDRPKYFARIMATYGLGFVLGPALSAILPNVTTKQKLLLASFFPLIGFFIQLLFFKETKQGVAHFRKESDKKAVKAPVSVSKKAPVNPKVLLLLLNGFLLMYAFSIETIYAMFIKDNFGYGERALSTLFACNGVLIGVFQVFFLKHLVGKIGKHWTLIIGSSMLSLGNTHYSHYFSCAS
jgi:MFS family permease